MKQSKRKAAPSTATRGRRSEKYQTKLDKRQARHAKARLRQPVCTLPCDPALFGKLRIRCWSYTDSRPSESTELHFPRYKGNPEWTLSSRWSSTPGRSTCLARVARL